jgi:branched-chain amino acid transport system substrate-binding protein
MKRQHLSQAILALAILLALTVTACAPAPTATPVPPTPVPATKAPAPTSAPTVAPTTVPTTAPTTAPTAVPATQPPVVVPGVTDTQIVLGSFGPQDGPAGAYGVIDRTVAAYWDMVNDQGGINGRKIKFIYENDSYAPAKTVAAVKKLVEEDKVFALVSGLGTANNLGVMDYLVQNNVPHVGPATGSSAMAVPLKKNVYAIQINYITEATLLTQYALDKLASKKSAVFYQNDSFGQEGLDAVNAELKKRNLSPATGVSYEAADTNFAAQALKLQTGGADTVVIWAVPKPGASVIAEMTKIGYQPKLLASAVINDPSIFQLAGPGIEGLAIPAWIPAFDDLTNPKIVEYQAFMKKYAPKEAIGGFSLSGYCEAMVMAEGLRRAGKNLTRESFEQAMDQMQNYTGSPLPNVSYSATDHAGIKTAYLQQAKGGQWVSFGDWLTVK